MNENQTEIEVPQQSDVAERPARLDEKILWALVVAPKLPFHWTADWLCKPLIRRASENPRLGPFVQFLRVFVRLLLLAALLLALRNLAKKDS
ncbi:hypothetical protein ACXR0O_04975 [Verrucomicrobiota bacterium sgz303538]